MSNSSPEKSHSEGNGENEELQHSAYHPSAPSDELFDILTTVDPSHIISLIRKLLPVDCGKHSLGSEAHDLPIEGSKTEKEGDIPENGAVQCVGNKSEATVTSETFVDLPDEGSKTEKEENVCENGGLHFLGNQNEFMDTSANFGEVPEAKDDFLHHQQKHHDSSVIEATWEEYGCTLWDLAANETHAELMVQNLILEVLQANLAVPHSARIKEICLGIIGNLACHEVSRKHICSRSGLVDAIVDQLFLDDAPCLCEVFRLITLCFQGGNGGPWIEALKSEHILSRILYIAENALNPQLIEKCVGLLSALIGSLQEITAILLPPLVKLGLPNILINLLAFEMKKLTQERISERYSVLDIILQAIEALSVADDFSTLMCCNKDLFGLLRDLIKFPDKAEIVVSYKASSVYSLTLLMTLKQEVQFGALLQDYYLLSENMKLAH